MGSAGENKAAQSPSPHRESPVHEHRSVAEEVEVCSDVFKEKNKHDE